MEIDFTTSSGIESRLEYIEEEKERTHKVKMEKGYLGDSNWILIDRGS